MDTANCLRLQRRIEWWFHQKYSIRLRKVNPVEAPGYNLQIPEDLDPEKFCRQIGGDCEEYADKFENITEVFTLDGFTMKKRDIPTK